MLFTSLTRRQKVITLPVVLTSFRFLWLYKRIDDNEDSGEKNSYGNSYVVMDEFVHLVEELFMMMMMKNACSPWLTLLITQEWRGEENYIFRRELWNEDFFLVSRSFLILAPVFQLDSIHTWRITSQRDIIQDPRMEFLENLSTLSLILRQYYCIPVVSKS